MAAPTILMEFKKTQQTWPGFSDVYVQARDRIRGLAQSAWGQSFGGLFPGANEFGETTIRPRFIALGTNTARETWERSLATGWKVAFSNNVLEDVYLGIAGLIIPEASNKVSAVQIKGGGKTLPAINVDGLVDVFEQPIVVFSDGLSVPEETNLELDIQSKQDGTKAVQPWGPAVAKQKTLISQTPS